MNCKWHNHKGTDREEKKVKYWLIESWWIDNYYTDWLDWFNENVIDGGQGGRSKNLGT